MKKIIATAAAVLSAAAFAELSADFSTTIGPVRPEIHSSGFGARALNSVISVSFCLNITASPEDLGLNAFKFR